MDQSSFEKVNSGVEVNKNEFARFEQDEAIEFRQQVQAGINRSMESDDEDFGPKPLMQTQELLTTKKVLSSV